MKLPVVTHHKKLLLLLLQPASTMLSCPAEGCTYRGKNDKALSNHLAICKKAASGLALIAGDVEQHEADYRQAKRCRILSPEHPEVLLDVEGPADVDYEVCIMNRALEADILWMCHSLIRMKTNKGIPLLSQTYLHPLSLPQPLLQVALAVCSNNHSDMAQRPTSTRRLRGILHQHPPHKSPSIHQPLQLNLKHSGPRKMSLGVSGFITSIPPWNFPTHPLLITMTLLDLGRFLKHIQRTLLLGFGCQLHS